MMPPVIMRIRLKEKGKRRFRLWLPLILLWPLALLVFILLIPFLVILSLLDSRSRKLTAAIPALYRTICSLRGLRVDIVEEDERIFIEFA